MTLGIDIGGTNIKFGIVDEDSRILKKYSIETKTDKGDKELVCDIIEKAKEIQTEMPYRRIGVGTPGTVEYKTGVCIRAANLPYKNTPVKKILEEALGLQVQLVNDATAAIYGELCAGAGKQYKNFIMITLGTGVGGGIVVDGKPYLGSRGCAGEFGHLIIDFGGLPCRCGARGCLEQYASVTALIRQTQEAAEKNPNSILAHLSAEGITGRTVFEARKQGCLVAEHVLNSYSGYVATGITSLTRIFQPEAVVLGGAISNEGEQLLAPIREKVALPVELTVSALKNDAGLIGAACVAKETQKNYF